MPTWFGGDQQGAGSLSQKAFNNPAQGSGLLYLPSVYLDFESNFDDKGSHGINGTASGTTLPTIDTTEKKLGTSSAKCPPGGYIQLDDKAKRYVIPDSNGDWSYLAWLKIPTPSAGISFLARQDPSSWDPGAIAFGVNSSGNMTLDVHGQSTQTLKTSFSSSDWQHVALIHDTRWPGKLSLYIDGTLEAHVSVILGSTTRSLPLLLMKSNSSSAINAYCDDCAFFDQVVSEEYLTALNGPGAVNAVGISPLS